MSERSVDINRRVNFDHRLEQITAERDALRARIADADENLREAVFTLNGVILQWRKKYEEAQARLERVEKVVEKWRRDDDRFSLMAGYFASEIEIALQAPIGSTEERE